jgi:hypothetical protein
MDLEEMGWEDTVYIHLTLNTDQLAAMNLLTAQNAGTLSG